jgi:spore coat polysaccharide biosynthesis protein SpsF
MTTVCIVQARMTSKRFPGKVLAELDGKPVLWHVLSRCLQIQELEAVGLAIPGKSRKEKSAAALIEIAERLNIHTTLGPEDDVLSRYLMAVTEQEKYLGMPIDRVVRITADCPLIDPLLCTEVVISSLRLPFGSNCLKRTFPKGMDCEVFTTSLLREAYDEASDLYDREHVTPWMIRNARAIVSIQGRVDHSSYRLTLDYPEDLQMMEALYAKGLASTHVVDIIEILEKHPEIKEINAGRN